MKKILSILGITFLPIIAFGAITQVPWRYNTTTGTIYPFPTALSSFLTVGTAGVTVDTSSGQVFFVDDIGGHSLTMSNTGTTLAGTLSINSGAGGYSLTSSGNSTIGTTGSGQLTLTSANILALNTTGSGQTTITSGGAGAINNMVIGGSVALAGTFTQLTSSGTTSLNTQVTHSGLFSCGTGGLAQYYLQGIEYCGSDNSDTGGVQILEDNGSSGTSAWGGFTLNNNLADNSFTHFGGIYLNSSNYTSSFFGTAFANKNQMIIQNTDGLLSLISSTSTTALNPTGINFITGGTASSNERMRITLAGLVGIGTTSPYAPLSVAGFGGVVAENFTATSTIATSTFSGGFTANNGRLVSDFSTGSTTISNLYTGNMEFDTDAGAVSWVDMTLSKAVNNTVESYTANLAGSPAITVYGLAAGSAALQARYPFVGIATTTPFTNFSFQGPTNTAAGGGGISYAWFAGNGSGSNASHGYDTFAQCGGNGASGGSTGGNGGDCEFYSGMGGNTAGGADGTDGSIYISTNHTTGSTGTAGNVVLGTIKGGTSQLGNVGIGTTSPYANLSVNTTAGQAGLAVGSSTGYTLIVDKVGTVFFGKYADCNGTTNALGVTSKQVTCDSLVSDERLKKDITPLTDGLDTILSLKPVSFFWKDLTNHNTSDSRKQIGFIAQQIESIIPSAVGKSPDGFLTLDKTSLIAPIVNSIQALVARISGVENKINELEKKNSELENRLSLLENKLKK